MTEKRYREIKENMGKASLEASKEVRESNERTNQIQKEAEIKLREMLY